MDRILDNARTGPLYLRRPEIAAMVAKAILYRQEVMGHYELHAYVIMANHVHLLITPCVEVSRLMQSLKRFTAREGNRLLGLTGQPFWQDESYDRLVRDQEEFQRIIRYIEMNPVKAGLAAKPEDFPWPSAGPIGNRPAGFQPAHKQIDYFRDFATMPAVSSIVKNWFAAVPPSFCFSPLGHSISIASTVESLPSPNVKARSLCEQ